MAVFETKSGNIHIIGPGDCFQIEKAEDGYQIKLYQRAVNDQFGIDIDLFYIDSSKTYSSLEHAKAILNDILKGLR